MNHDDHHENPVLRPKVLVTGANGFLGCHIVRLLLDRGYAVRAFVLKGTSSDTLPESDCEIFEGDLLNERDVDRALSGCDSVIHTAAITDVWPTVNPLSWTVNFELVRRLAGRIRAMNVRRYVHVGTANSFGFGTKDAPGDENTPFNSGGYGLDYINSKKAAQDYLLAEAKAGLPVVIVNPTFMIGDNDAKPGPGEMIISVMKGKVPAYASGGRSFAPVKDVAAATVNALEMGRVGECYIAGGTNLNYREFFTMIGEIARCEPPKHRISKPLAMLFATLVEWAAGARRKKPLLTRAMARISGDGHYYSSRRAIAELGYVKTDVATALREAILWYQEHGYVE
ncbi:MAG: NAD-dependent epimerase/dehydratase family protein [Candidatus Izemoplasmatales bacterium]